MAATPASRKPVPRHVVLRIAGEVPADPKTVEKVIAGEPVRGSIYFRIVAACEKAGINVPGTSEGDDK